MKNPVRKNLHRFNKPVVHKDKTKYNRKRKNIKHTEGGCMKKQFVTIVGEGDLEGECFLKDEFYEVEVVDGE